MGNAWSAIFRENARVCSNELIDVVVVGHSQRGCLYNHQSKSTVIASEMYAVHNTQMSVACKFDEFNKREPSIEGEIIALRMHKLFQQHFKMNRNKNKQYKVWKSTYQAM